MVLKVRAFENNEEKIIPISDITGTINRAREIFDVSAIVAEEITLSFSPLEYSEMVVLNGLVMTNDIACDYTLAGNVITFNSGVLTNSGHVLINYSYN